MQKMATPIPIDAETRSSRRGNLNPSRHHRRHRGHLERLQQDTQILEDMAVTSSAASWRHDRGSRHFLDAPRRFLPTVSWVNAFAANKKASALSQPKTRATMATQRRRHGRYDRAKGRHLLLAGYRWPPCRTKRRAARSRWRRTTAAWSKAEQDRREMKEEERERSRVTGWAWQHERKN